MKAGVFTLLFGEKAIEPMPDYLCSPRVQAVEFGTGRYVRALNFPVEGLLSSDAKMLWLKDALGERESGNQRAQLPR